MTTTSTEQKQVQFDQLCKSIKSACTFLEKQDNSDVLADVITRAKSRFAQKSPIATTVHPCPCVEYAKNIVAKYKICEDQIFESHSQACKKIVRCYRSNPESSAHKELRSKFAKRLMRVFLTTNQDKLQTEPYQSFMSILSVLVAIICDQNELSSNQRSLGFLFLLRKCQFRRIIRSQIRIYLQPSLHNAQFVRSPSQIGSHHQWRLCQSFEALLITSSPRKRKGVVGTFILSDSLVQNAFEKITSWQIPRSDAQDDGAFRSGDNGQAAVNVTIAGLYALLQFDRILQKRTNSTCVDVDEATNLVAAMPVPQRILSIPIHLRIRKTGLWGSIEMDPSGAWAALLFSSICILLSFISYPRPISKTAAVPTSLATTNRMSMGITVVVIVAVSFYYLSRRLARLRFNRIIDSKSSNNLSESIINLEKMQNLFRVEVATSLEQLAKKKAIPPDLAAKALSELIQANYVTKWNDFPRKLLTDLLFAKNQDPTDAVAYLNNVDKALQLTAILDLFKILFSEEDSEELEEEKKKYTKIAYERIKDLIKDQEQSNARSGGWRINDKDSRASVFATTQVIRALSRIVDSKDPDDREFRERIKENVFIIGKKPFDTIEKIKDAVASGVTYLRADLLEKLDRESQPWSQATGTRIEIYRIASPLVALSERATYRGKHGGDELEIRAAIDWLQSAVLNQSCPHHEDQVMQRAITDRTKLKNSKFEEFVHRHMVARNVVEGILIAESSIETSFLQSQLGPTRTSDRPITSRLFHTSIQRCLFAMQYLLYSNSEATPERVSDLVDTLAISNRCRRHIKRNLTAGQIWIEYCRVADFISARPLPLLHWLPRSPRDLKIRARPVLVAVQLNRPARLLFFWSGIIGLFLTLITGRLFGSTDYSLLQWQILMAISTLPLIIPLAAVFQFVTKPKTIGSSLRWSAAAIVSQFISLTGFFR